ncbi:LysR substrate-binding domain-containing protein [Vogesella sp. LIG4]|uniref:LysR substrate-binding domain-containing protein n=1 Tax=Vogesella sp. LIG4 TaxID=1192162 RepID=UPI00138FF33D|nr:LysR substrate-binding domain-containing protein [Vogesella sp. LIG4]
MRRLPPLQCMLAFEASARLGSFSRAAAELALTQSAISHQIQHLEEWVAQPLFRRIGRGVALTAAGELFLQTVQDTIKLLSNGRDRIEPYGNLNSVLLYSPPHVTYGWLMPRLPALKARYPELEIWLLSEREIREIDRIDVDLIISAHPSNSPDMVCMPLMNDGAVAVCGPQTAQRLAARPFPQVLSEVPLLSDEARPEWAPWMPELRRQGLEITRALTVEDQRLLLSAAEQEMGIAMVSRLLADDALRHGRLVELTQIPGFALPPLWLKKSRLPPRTEAAEVTFDWLLAAATG